MTSDFLNLGSVPAVKVPGQPGVQVNKTLGVSDSERPVGEVEKSAATALESKLLQLEQDSNEAKKLDEQLQNQPGVEPLSAEELREILDEINSALYSHNRALRFEINDRTDDIVVRVMNTKTDEVIRQYPSEEVLALRARLLDGETQFFSTQVS